jgi:ubiquinone/menaquinone biosynthesis C-methylase UbiE
MQITHERVTLGGHFPSEVEREHLERYSHVLPHIQGLRVLDLACGSGYGSHKMAEGGAQSVLGIDVSADAVEFARANFASGNLHFQVGDAQKLEGVPDNSIDAVISFETIEHLPNVDEYLAEVHRILKPAGLFVVSTPDRHFSTLYPITGRPNNQFHVREFTRRELDRLLSLRFEVTDWFGQSFVNRLFVFWPLQVLLKGSCYALRRFGAYRLVARWYRYGSDLEVRSSNGTGHAVPRFWIAHCRKPR